MTARGSAPTSSGGPPTDAEIMWICPYCKRSGIEQHSDDEDPERNAVAALRSHIRDADSDGHGPRNAVPADRERTLFEYVRLVARDEGRREQP